MSKRFLIAFAGFILSVGSGSVLFYYYWLKRRKITKNLLSMQKTRRFFWYLLRKNGFHILSYDDTREITFLIDGTEKAFSFRCDFMVKKDGKKYAAVFAGEKKEELWFKTFFLYLRVFKVNGVIFYDEIDRSYEVWEL